MQLPQPTETTTVRTHTALLLLHPCSKLWYLCRAIDPSGRGYVTVTQQQLQMLNESKSTIYRWLSDGKKLGFFIAYRFRGNTLHASLGGLLRVCRQNSIRHWGATAAVNPDEILSSNGRRVTASLITIQALQASSHYAARHQLTELERQRYPVPEVNDLLNLQTSQKLASGGTPGVLHVTDTKIWVSRRFVPFGVSQERVSEELNSRDRSCGVSSRTIRRHIATAEVTHKQIVQGKGEYTQIGKAIEHGSTSYKANDVLFHWSAREPEKIVLRETQGISKAQKEDGHTIPVKQLFKHRGGRYWLNRCNIYQLDFELKSMRFTRNKLKRSVAKVSPPAPPSKGLNIFPQAQPLGAAWGNENKEDKNENFSNPCPTSDAANEAHKAWFAQAMEKMKQEKREYEQAVAERRRKAGC